MKFNSTTKRILAGITLSGLAGFNALEAGLEWQEIEGPAGTPGSFGPGVELGGQLYMTTFGGLQRSTDGLTWENLGPFQIYSTWLDGLTLEDGTVFLFAPRSGSVGRISPEGLLQTQSLSSEFGGTVRAAAAGNGRIVLGGGYSFTGADPAWWVSTDGGQSFTGYPGDGRIGDVGIEESIKGLQYYNGQFVAVGYPGEVWTSPDGESWTLNLIPTVEVARQQREVMLFDLEVLGGVLYASGSFTTLYKSTDGINWELVYQGSSSFDLERFHVDGQNVHAVSARGGHLYSSDGGQNWSYGNASNTNLLNIMGGGDYKYAGRYFAPANGSISFFTKVEFDELPAGTGAVVYGSGKWIVRTSAGTYLLGTNASSVFDEATTTDGTVYEHPWLGQFVFGTAGWVYHFNLGWIYTEARSGDDVWIFTPQLGWIHTRSTVWPAFYHGESGDWGLYEGSGELFYNLTAGALQSAETFGQEAWIVSAEWLIGKTLTITDSMGTHTVEIVDTNSVNATFNVQGKTLVYSTADTTTWFDSSATAALPEGRRFTFDIADITAPGIGDRVFPLIFTFENSKGGTSLLTYTYLSGFTPVSGTSIPGTFTVSQ